MSLIRQQEAAQAAHTLHAKLTLLSFPDFGLPYVPFKTLVETTLPHLREHRTDVLFSFDSRGIDQSIDHLDHMTTGLVARQIGAGINVKNYAPNTPAPKSRPDLFVRTFTKESTHHLPVSKKARERHNNYLIRNHPSQFSAETRLEWIPIFEALTKTTNHRHTERYFRVR